MIFEVQHTVLRYDVCYDKYIDLSPTLGIGSALEDLEVMRKMERIWSKKNCGEYHHIFRNIPKYKISDKCIRFYI